MIFWSIDLSGIDDTSKSEVGNAQSQTEIFAQGCDKISVNALIWIKLFNIVTH